MKCKKFVYKRDVTQFNPTLKFSVTNIEIYAYSSFINNTNKSRNHLIILWLRYIKDFLLCYTAFNLATNE